MVMRLAKYFATNISWIGIVLGLVGAIGACHDTTAVSPVAGTYVATKFDLTSQGQGVRNALAEGAMLTIEIAADSSTSGSLTVPASITGSTLLVASMAGKAVFEGDSVRFDQAANSFVRQDYWAVKGSTISMSHTVDGVTIAVTLSR